MDRNQNDSPGGPLEQQIGEWRAHLRRSQTIAPQDAAELEDHLREQIASLTADGWALAVATLCFGGALLTKNEGTLFALAAFVGLLAVAHRRWRPLAVVAAIDVALLLPWKLYVRSHHLQDINYKLTDSFDVDHIRGRLGVGPIAFRTLAGEMVDPRQWGLLMPLFVTLVLVALLLGASRPALFGAVTAGLSWLGLSWIYVISHFEYSSYLDSTKERVVASVVLGSAALIPLLASEAWVSVRGRDRPRDGGARTP